MPDVTLASFALTSLEAVKEELPVDGQKANLDNRLRRRINAASRMIILYAGREFKPLIANPSTRTFTTTGGLVDLSPYDLQPAGAGLALSTLTGAGTTLVTTALTTSDYLFPYGDTITSFTLTTTPIVPTRVSITGTWGWLTVPDDVESMCIQQVVLWTRRDQFLRSDILDVPEDALAPPGAGLSGSVRRYLDASYRVPAVA